VLCVLNILLCDHGLIFHKNNSRSDYVFNNGVQLLDQENRRKYLICIEISIGYVSQLDGIDPMAKG
jgi:hypothetical protein